MATATKPATGLPPCLPHQDRAIEEIMQRDFLLVEYGTGTGKTRVYVEAIEALLLAGEMPILLAVPNSLIEQTVQEFRYWIGEDWVEKNLEVLDGNLRIEIRRQQLRFGKKPVFLISHESMSYPLVKEGLFSRRWEAVFLDEASRFRNYSNRTKTLTGLGRRAATRYAFTGNLAPRVPSDVWYVAGFLNPGCFGTTNRQTFITNTFLMGGFENRQVVMIRPDKKASFLKVMDGLRITCDLADIRAMPPRVLHQHFTTMPDKTRREYKTLQETLRLEIERVDDATFKSMVRTYATRLQRLQEIGSGFARNVDGDVVYLPCSKTTTLLDLLEDEPETPTIVWGWWVPEMQQISDNLTKHGIPHTTFGHAKDSVEQFMSGRVNVFVSQLARGGFGLNLTRATRMIYHSLPWSLDVYLQSQERNMRLTTTAPHLEVIHLTNRRSVDEYVRSRLLERADVSAQLTRSKALELLRA